MSKYIRERELFGGLVQRSYTKKAFFDRHWTDETIRARGHVVDAKGNFVARPFDKFFNIDEVEETKMENIFKLHQETPGSVFHIYNKFNGHLAILFYHGGKWINTTRGGYDTDMTRRDRKLIDKVVNYPKLDTGYTYCFEIMDPEQDPHVVHPFMRSDYLNTAILVGMRVNESGRFLPPASAHGVEWFDTHIPKIKISESFKEFYQMVEGLKKQKYVEGSVVHLIDQTTMQPILTFKVKTDHFLKLRYYWYGVLGHPAKVKEIILDMTKGIWPDEDEELIPVFKKIYDDAIAFGGQGSVKSWLEMQDSFQNYIEHIARWN